MEWLNSALKSKRLAVAIGLALTAAFLAVRFLDPVPLQVLRLKTFDLYQRVHPREPVPQPVVIIDLDEESLAAHGQWPWPRAQIARLVTGLFKQGVAVVGFDIVFPEPDRTSPAAIVDDLPGLDAETRERLLELPSGDLLLANVVERHRVVLGQSTVSRASLRADEIKAVKTSVGMKSVPGVDLLDHAFRFIGLVRNLPELEDAANGLGVFTLRPEIDGIVRRVPMVARVGKQLYPSLTLEMLRLSVGGQRVIVQGDAAGINSVKLTRDLAIPTDDTGRAWVNYAPHDRSRYVSAKDVLDGTVPPGRLAGHLALIGTSAVGLLDIKSTPVDDAMPGVEVHAQLLETVLLDLARQQLRNGIAQLEALPSEQRDKAMLAKFKTELARQLSLGPAFLIRPNYTLALELAVLLGMCLLMMLLVMWLGAIWTFAAGAVVTGALLAGSWYAYVEHGLLLDVAYVAAAGFVLYSVLTYLSYVREEAERRLVRGQFAQYMSPALVEQLAKNPDRLKLGGEMRDMTLLFCDIRGFTSISELYKSDPQGLTALINRFLTPMTNLILERRGTIDKYMGDCIMAFWNAPLDDDDHARNACESALEMMTGVVALNDRLREEAEAENRRYIPINIGIGLNSGECCVGNMGSEQRFDYSVLGDDVNLASRLEGQSKTYGVGIVIGENTYKRADDYAAIELDLIKVKGKDEAVRIFALMGSPDEAKDESFQTLAQAHGAMLAAYRGQRWSRARDLIRECRAKNRGLAGLYDLYDERIDEYVENPPGDDWDGVYVATSK